MNDEGPRDFTDRVLCELLGKPENLREFLRAVVPDLVDNFDFERMRPAPQEFLVGNWRRRKPDVLVEIPYHTGDAEQWALVCVLVEHQTQSDWRAPLKTFLYAALYWEWQWRNWEAESSPKADFVLTPVLPFILHTGPRPWGSARTLRDLAAPLDSLRPFVPDWHPAFWELARHSADELLDTHEAFLQALAIFKADDADLADAEQLFTEVFRNIDPLHETGRVRWQDLLGLLLGWAHNRRSKAERPRWHDLAIDLQASADRKREINKMGMTIAQEIRQEGREEGLQLGAIAHARSTLVRLGRKWLGQPNEATQAAINAVSDLDRLDRMTERLDDVKSWDELLRTE
jgi:hypothetical protein